MPAHHCGTKPTGRGRSPMAGRRHQAKPAPHNNGTTQHRRGIPKGDAFHGGPPDGSRAALRYTADGGTQGTARRQRRPGSRAPLWCLDPRTRHVGPWSLGVTGRPTPSPCNGTPRCQPEKSKTVARQKASQTKRQGPQPAGRRSPPSGGSCAPRARRPPRRGVGPARAPRQIPSVD